MKYIKKSLILMFILFSFSFFSFSNVIANNDVQESCYQDLIVNMEKLPLFEKGLSGFSKLSYEDLENEFSRYYKNMSSFGIDLDEALFEMRLYSFGEQTGYIHPPYSPYPVYDKTDKWDESAKEYIIAEEYVTLPSGERQFLSCAFMQIEAEDLMKVTSENYLYDGDIISVIQTNNEDYKVWYNENVSIDYDNNPLVTWRRLFVYPKETKNDYFDKYSILESFPTNTVEDLKDMFVLNSNGEVFKFKEEKQEGETRDGMIDGAIRLYITNDDGEYISYAGPEALRPIKKEGLNQIFALNSYYQSIENSFPEFSKQIALRGILHYDILKEILATGDDNDFAYIWETILDTRAITVYASEKKKGILEFEDAFYEDELNNIENIEKNIKDLLNKEKNNDENVEKKPNSGIQESIIIIPEVANNDIQNQQEVVKVKEKNNLIKLIVFLLLAFTTILAFIVLKRKK